MLRHPRRFVKKVFKKLVHPLRMHTLVKAARSSLQNAHAPYSNYRVGAAIRTEGGDIYTGCNIEFANYSNTIHAEEVALAKAVSSDYTEFVRLAITSDQKDGTPPCGMCRQSLNEFCDGDFRIIVDEADGFSEYYLKNLLPAAMGQETLGP